LTTTYHSVERGFAFCRPDGAPDDKSQDVFVHGRALERSGILNLVKGARIEFDPVPSRRHPDKLEASNIRLPQPAIAISGPSDDSSARKSGPTILIATAINSRQGNA
jgi:cold shock CspA family protein